jgi:hypothetical protein
LDEAECGLNVPDLQAVWQYLVGCPTVESATDGRVHRGIEWKLKVRENVRLLVSSTPKDNFRLGVPPARKTESYSFQTPQLKYLNFDPLHRRRRAFDLPWGQAKVIMNAQRKGRSPWRLAAFPDEVGIACYHTFIALWPAGDWGVHALAAALNGPVANAYMATHTVDRHVPGWAVKSIPLPRLSPPQVERIQALVLEYLGIVGDHGVFVSPPLRTPERVLLEIDAAILEGYDLPPRLERKLLDYFNGYGDRRTVSHAFGDYFPADFRPLFSLSEYLSAEFQRSTAREFKKARKLPSSDILKALDVAANGYEGS